MKKFVKKAVAFVVVFALLAFQTVAFAATTINVKVSGTEVYAKAWEVLELVNQERTAVGLSELKMDEDLMRAAMLRASELSIFYDHTRPDGSGFYTAIDVSYYYTGENAAMARSSATAVMNSWMNSTGHKNNILNTGYERIGIGAFYHNGQYYWVQIFDGLTTSNEASQRSDTVDVTRDITVTTPIDVSGTSYDTITLTSKTTELNIHENESQEITILNKNAATGLYETILGSDSDFSYTTTNSDVAIYEDGKIVAKGVGTAEVTVYLTGYSGSSVTFDVNVPATIIYTAGEQGRFADNIHENINYGDSTPAYSGTTDSDGNPTGNPGYMFIGWSPGVSETVSSSVTYTAQWERIKYTVTYSAGEQGTFDDDVHYPVYYGESTPSYSGTTDSDGNPIGNSGYMFIGWSTDVADTVTDNVTYIAQWEKIKYTVTYSSGEQGTFDDDIHYPVYYGDATPSYSGATDSDGNPVGNSGYEFIGWSIDVADTVTGNVTYVAQWKKLSTSTNKESSNPSSIDDSGSGTDNSTASNSSSNTPKTGDSFYLIIVSFTLITFCIITLIFKRKVSK